MGIAAKFLKMLLPNSSRIYLTKYNQDFAADMRPGALMLDAGAGEAPYKSLFQHVIYESADFEQVDKPYAKSTYVCDLCDRIPVDDNRFDYIVFNQTLEHLKEPKRALAELYRVLAPGGKILCTVPLFYEEHEKPFDFFRYTQFAHRYLFAEAGFKVERTERLEGFFGTCGYMLETIFNDLPVFCRKKPRIMMLFAPFLLGLKISALFAAAVLYRLDLLYKVTDLGFPKNYVTIASKH